MPKVENKKTITPEDDDDFPICQVSCNNQGPTPPPSIIPPFKLGNEPQKMNMSGMGQVSGAPGMFTMGGNPIGFGNCCGPPRSMGPFNPIGSTGPMINPMGPPQLKQSNQTQLNIIYNKLSEVRKEIAMLNKLVDDIYQILPNIQ